MYNPETIATAIIEAAAGIADRSTAAAKVDQTLSGILTSAEQYLVVADAALQAGEVEAAMFALAASDAACRLVDVLLADPDNLEAVALAAPWSTSGVTV